MAFWVAKITNFCYKVSYFRLYLFFINNLQQKFYRNNYFDSNIFNLFLVPATLELHIPITNTHNAHETY